MHRAIFRNCLVLAALAEGLTLILIVGTWALIALGMAALGDPLTNTVIAGAFTLVGMQIGLAGEFAPDAEQGGDGSEWYPNVLIHVGAAVFNVALLLAMGLYAVIINAVAAEYVIYGALVGMALGIIGLLFSLAARFAPQDRQ